MPILGVVHGTKIGPNAPTVTSVTDVGLNREFDNGAVDVAFTPAAVNSAVSYRVTSSNGQVATGSSSPIRVQNLPTGINTTFTVTGVNNITIEGPPSAVSSGVVVTTVPFRPTMGVATAGNGQAFVVFTLLNSGGKQVISYVATGSPAGTANNTGSPITVPSLNNNVPHAFTVIAVNANGSSLASNPSNIVTPSTGGGGVPVGTFYCYSSDCFSQDGINFAYLRAPTFTSVSPTDQTTLENYSGGFGFARGTRVTYCNIVEATAAIGAQQSSCQVNYVEPPPPPPCPPEVFTTECGPYTAGPQVAGCSPTNADYGYTVTETATRTQTTYDCNGIITDIAVLTCTRSTFTTTSTNYPACPGYRAQQTTTSSSGGTTNYVPPSQTSTTSTTTNQSTTPAFSSVVGTLTRVEGSGYIDESDGPFAYYQTVNANGDTVIYVLPEYTENGVPTPNRDTLSVNTDPVSTVPNPDPLANDGRFLGENNTTYGQNPDEQPSQPDYSDFTMPPLELDFFGPGFGENGIKSINIFTLVRTLNGLIPAWHLKVGDKLLSANIESFPYDNLLATDMELIEWDAQNPQINLVETEIVSLRTRIAKWAILVDGDIFSDTHYILVKRDDVTKFVKSIDLEPTDLIWSNSDQNWIGIGLLRKIEVNHEVVSIDCEPYDIFFTERMLTHDSSTVD